ncbi:hypothetical protein MW887_008542 [Aspergillus wentii]|nr:hypothetical protein MW887_008542 [Aspergillus wentii]
MQKTPIISLAGQPPIPNRRIIIPVDIPEIQVVHTAELKLGNLSEQPAHAAVGEMISAELCLRHTRRWCSTEHQENAGEPLEFSYEIHSNPEMWLIGGRKRGNFTAKEGETTTFAVMLLPQKSGHLLFPGLEIRTFVPPSAGQRQTSTAAGVGGAGGMAPAQRRQIACEVDYRNHGETVLVLPDLRKTTVSLSPSGGSHGGGSWLVDSERRTDVSV